MPYYKNKNVKINVYTLINTHWTDKTGLQVPPLVDPATDQYLDTNLRQIVKTTYDADSKEFAKIYPPKLIPGFIPSSKDLVTNFAKPDEFCDPLFFNTSFCVNIPSAAKNAPQARKGTKVTLSSIYITGSVHKPEIPLPLNNPFVPTITQTRCLNSLTSNQVTYYLVYQQCRNVNEGVPDWRTIFYLNGSNKVCPTTYANTNRVNNALSTNTVQPIATTNIGTGICRFTHPDMYLNVDSKEKFVLLASYTLDLDQENTQFQFKIYEKMIVALPMFSSKKKNPIQTVFSNVSTDNTLNFVEGGAVYLIRSCYGVYNELLQVTLQTGDKTSTGTTLALTTGSNETNNSYLDGCKLYPNESYTMKVNYYDV